MGHGKEVTEPISELFQLISFSDIKSTRGKFPYIFRYIRDRGAKIVQMI